MLPDLIIPMAMAGPWIPPSPRGRTKDAYLFLSFLPDLVPARNSVGDPMKMNAVEQGWPGGRGRGEANTGHSKRISVVPVE